MEGLQLGGDLSQRDRMGHGHGAEEAVPVSFSLQRGEKLVHHVVDVHQVQPHRRIVYRNGQTACNVVAEGCHHAVVVGPTPLAEHIGQPVNENRRAGLLSIAQQQVLPRLLAAAIRVVQLRLDG